MDDFMLIDSINIAFSIIIKAALGISALSLQSKGKKD